MPDGQKYDPLAYEPGAGDIYKTKPLNLGNYYQLEGEYIDAEGNPIRVYVPRVSVDELDKISPTYFYENMVAINMLNGEPIEMTPAIRNEVLGFYKGMDILNFDGIYAALEGYFQQSGMFNEFAYPDVQDFLLEKVKLWQQGQPFNLSEITNISRRLTTEPDFAKQMRAAGLMGVEGVIPLPAEQALPTPQGWSGLKYYRPEEVEGEPELAGAGIVIAPDIQTARGMGAFRYIPTKSFSQAKYEQTKQQMEAQAQVGYPQTPEFIEQHARWVATGGQEPINISIQAAQGGAPTAQQIQEQTKLKQRQEEEWQKLVRTSKIRPQRVTRI